MAKSGIKHADVGVELKRSEWESEESHELVHGVSFPASPVERQVFYRDDLHMWYQYRNSAWRALASAGETKLNDIGDVSVPSPADGYVLYWDNATSLWKAKAPIFTKILDADHDTGFEVEKTADEDKIRGKVKGVEAFHLSDVGILTLAKQSSARAWLDGDQTGIADSTWTKINLNAKTHDIQGEFDIANHKFTAAEAGKYLAIAVIAYKQPTVDQAVYYCSIYKNGVHYSSTLWSPSGTVQISTLNMDIISLAEGDYLELYAYHKAGVNQTARGLETSTFLSVQKIM
ncbi:MAG: hypothetical protein JRD89_09370 [Deltaproteobacteria bacterium]|nr:hypothetical protein [Deltaproteobacteria bacterium]